MCMRICYVHFCCQPAPQLQNYSSLWMITYQENWIGLFVSVYIWTEQLPWLDVFLVSLLGSKRLLLNVSLRTVSSIEKCWLAEKCHLNLATFCRMWLKLSTTGLSWWCSGWGSACRCRGHGFEPWSGSIPYAAEQLSAWATTTEPACLEPVLRNGRGPRQWEACAPRWRVAPAQRNWRKPSHRNEDPTQPKINK